MNATGAVRILQRWAELGKRLRQDLPAPVPWQPAALMVAAAERDSGRAAEALKFLLEQSQLTMFPSLGDPLDATLDFGAHRWLDGAREESYSDWLAWILNRQGESAHVLRLFGLEPGPLVDGECRIDREVQTAHGRLDIVIHCGTRATLAVEIKTTSPPGDEQLSRYFTWLKTQPAPLGLVLLAIDQPESLVSNRWSFRSWEKVSAGLADLGPQLAARRTGNRCHLDPGLLRCR